MIKVVVCLLIVCLVTLINRRRFVNSDLSSSSSESVEVHSDFAYVKALKSATASPRGTRRALK